MVIHTIGYQNATVQTFLAALEDARVDLLVDVRAAARSRRPGFAKTALAANVEGAGIEYLHVPRLGTPADGRSAARAGQHEEMRRIFRAYLATPDAQAALHGVAEIVRSGRQICLMCLEAEPEHCHRRLVSDALAELLPARIVDLRPESEG